MEIAKTSKPPYYAVIFSSMRTEDIDGYRETSDRRVELAQQQHGYLGHESVREELGITVSYWESPGRHQELEKKYGAFIRSATRKRTMVSVV